jgi:hypothetical protein
VVYVGVVLNWAVHQIGDLVTMVIDGYYRFVRWRSEGFLGLRSFY